MGRNLTIISENMVQFNKFSTMYKDGFKTCKKLVTEKEMEKAKELLKIGDENEIDNFCYSIA